MKRTHLIILAAMALFSVTAFAAPPTGQPGGRPDGRKGFARGPRTAFQLARLAQNVGNLPATDKNRLTAEQAKKILGIITPLRKLISLSDVQAKVATVKINAVLTAEQKKMIGAMKPERRMGGGPGMHEGRGGPGGMPPGERMDGMAGEGRHPDRGMMEDFNPFNPSKDMPMAGELSKQCNDLFKKLEKIAGISSKPVVKK